jgi:hypothetical protein
MVELRAHSVLGLALFGGLHLGDLEEGGEVKVVVRGREGRKQRRRRSRRRKASFEKIIPDREK